jgi:hypothetical protein
LSHILTFGTEFEERLQILYRTLQLLVEGDVILQLPAPLEQTLRL